ncbi:MAG: WYL domain-containing protein [Muribaculaceae bacterium]|nr:WYL domain-containing protein [Muribaculaceae bacterium]
MPRDQISRYVWIVDTLTRYGRLTRQQLNNLWMRSQFSEGEPMPERTFYHYRRAIEEIFQIDIACDTRGNYYIAGDNSRQSRAFTNWMLDSYAVSNAIKGGDAPMDRVDIEDVPSAREFLPTVLDAIRNSHKIVFTYAGFNRSRAEKDIRYEPYFLKRYKQRWYMIGLKEKGNGIRTYALDRVKEMKILDEPFVKPEHIELDDLFGNIVGVTTSKADVRTVRLQATPTQAKYFRALPLHSSQEETIHDLYSVFTYRLKLNYELAHEIMGFGGAVKVLDPPELRAMVVTELRQTLQQYDGGEVKRDFI